MKNLRQKGSALALVLGLSACTYSPVENEPREPRPANVATLTQESSVYQVRDEAPLEQVVEEEREDCSGLWAGSLCSGDTKYDVMVDSCTGEEYVRSEDCSALIGHFGEPRTCEEGSTSVSTAYCKNTCSNPGEEIYQCVQEFSTEVFEEVQVVRRKQCSEDLEIMTVETLDNCPAGTACTYDADMDGTFCR